MSTTPSYLLKFDGSLIVYFNGNVKMFATKDTLLADALIALKNRDYDQLVALMNYNEAAVARLTNGKVSIVGDVVYYNHKPVHNALTKRILTLLDAGSIDMLPITNFMNNLMQNPSQKSRDQLFGFLDACDLPITEDGHFLAYKMVREDYYDQHSHTILNRVGTTVSMPRDEVDDNEQQTCSHGLHVASLAYISNGNYGSGSGARLLVCKINPADVVAVPVDYNNSKMRVCKYYIQDEITDPNMMPKNIEKVPEHSNNELDYNSFFEDEDESEENETFILKSDDEAQEIISVYKDAEGEPAKPQPVRVLSQEKLNEIWRLIESDYSDTEIQDKTGVNRRTVYRVRTAEAYKDSYNNYLKSLDENETRGCINPSLKSYADYVKIMDAFYSDDARRYWKLADEMGISPRALNNIVEGKTYLNWRHMYFGQ